MASLYTYAYYNNDWLLPANHFFLKIFDISLHIFQLEKLPVGQYDFFEQNSRS